MDIKLIETFDDSEVLKELEKIEGTLTGIATEGDKAGQAISDGFQEATASTENFTGALQKNAAQVAAQAANVQQSQRGLSAWLRSLRETIGGLQVGGKSLSEWSAGMRETAKGGADAAASTEKAGGAFKIFNTVLKASIIGAIVAAVIALIGYFKQFQPVVDTVSRVTAAFNAVVNELANRIIKVGEAFGKLFDGDFAGAIDTLAEAGRGLGDALVNAATAAFELEKRAQALRDLTIATSVAAAQQRATLEKLKDDAKDETLSYRARTEAIRKGFEVESQLSEQRIALAKENRDIIIAQNKLAADNVDNRQKAADAEITLIEAQSESDKIRRDFEKELRELRKQASEERKRQLEDEVKALAEVQKALERLRVEAQPAGIEKDLAATEKKYDDLQAVAAAGIKKLRDIEKRRDLSPAELDQIAELGRLSVQLEERRLEALLDVVSEFAEKDAELDRQQREAKEKLTEKDRQRAIKSLENRKKLGEEEIEFTRIQGEGLIKRLEANGARQEVIEQAKNDLTEMIQAKRLENEIAFNQRLLDLETDPERISQIIATLRKLQAELANLDIEGKDPKGKPLTIWDLLGIEDPDVQGGIGEAVRQITSAINEITEANVRAAEQRRQAADDALDEVRDRLKKEEELNREGAANNLNLVKLELAQKKAARDAAFKDEQKAKRAQILLESVEQVSALITSSANIFKSLSGIPFVGVPLAIGLIGAMFGAFAIAKTRALQAVNQEAPKLRQGRRIVGKSHVFGGEKFTGIDGRTYEGENLEWVVGTEHSREHDKFLSRMNAGEFRHVDLNREINGAGRQYHNPLAESALRTNQIERERVQAESNYAFAAMAAAYERGTDRVVNAIGRKPVIKPFKGGYIEEITDGNNIRRKRVIPSD